MTLSATNFLVKQYLKTRQKRIQRILNEPLACQEDVLYEILRLQKSTQWGKKYGYKTIKNQVAYKTNVPIISYEDILPWIERMIAGEPDVLHPGCVNMFAKSSGTSNDQSKYIPLSKKMLSVGHDTASWDLLSTLYHVRPDTKIFVHKNLIMGGSVHSFQNNSEAIYGDISAITLNNLPPFSRPYYTPDFETALLDDWEEKINRMVKICSEVEVTMLAGVPSWTLILLQKIIAYKQVETMEQVWDEASIFIHGGVGFEPYRSSFDKLFPSGKLAYMQVYNASEGFFAFQNDINSDDLLLLLDHGVYYEFIPSAEFENQQPKTITLREVEVNQVYALVISTYSGLSRYRLGDTIIFTSTAPYKIKVVGREQQFINAFGEELMIHNAELAIARTAEMHRVTVNDYTVAPQYIEGNGQGCHQWLIEFEKEPHSLSQFTKSLDAQLQAINSDYQAKRSYDLVMKQLTVTSLPCGTFKKWMRNKGKLGGQNKVPRLSNDRNLLEQILKSLKTTHV